MKLVDLNICRDGPMMASEVEAALNGLAQAIVARIEEAEAETDRLRRKLDTERRLRLGRKCRR